MESGNTDTGLMDRAMPRTNAIRVKIRWRHKLRNSHLCRVGHVKAVAMRLDCHLAGV